MSDRNDKTDNRWLTVAKASAEYGISERTLQRRIKAGTLTSKIERGRRIILVSSLAELAEPVVNVGAVAELPVDSITKENEQLRDKINSLEEELRQQRQRDDSNRQEMAKLAETIHQKDEEIQLERMALEDAKQSIQELTEDMRRQSDTHRQEVAKLAEEIKVKEEDLRQERERSDKAKERSDMITISLTRNLNEMQRSLEMKNMSFWRRLRLGKGKEKDKDDQQ